MALGNPANLTLEEAVAAIDTCFEAMKERMQKRAELLDEFEDLGCQMGEFHRLARELAAERRGDAGIGGIVVDDQGIRYRVTNKRAPGCISELTSMYNYERRGKTCGQGLVAPTVDDYMGAPEYEGSRINKNGTPTVRSWAVRGKTTVEVK